MLTPHETTLTIAPQVQTGIMRRTTDPYHRPSPAIGSGARLPGAAGRRRAPPGARAAVRGKRGTGDDEEIVDVDVDIDVRKDVEGGERGGIEEELDGHDTPQIVLVALPVELVMRTRKITWFRPLLAAELECSSRCDHVAPPATMEKSA